MRGRPRGPFRKDIEGLRALAVLLVVFWHADAPLVSGGFVGVDVFFVISGYLITRGMVAEVAERGRLSLVGFYARRAKRLLPSATVVLLAALILTYLFLPDVRWRQTTEDVVSSALYFVNWQLADRAVDYLAAEQAPSIVQHYWSLAVEEQFYVIWPVLLAGLAWCAFRRGTKRRGFETLAIGVVALVGLASLAWSVHLVETDPGRAYFVSTTRVWELAVGALLALLPLRPAGAWVAVLGWAGMAAVVGSAVLLDTAAPFPGMLAIPVTVGTALVIVAGRATRSGPVVLLGLPPMQFVGGISYTLYLWHWPLLVALSARVEDPGVTARAAVVALSILLAYLTSRIVERPIWHSPGLSVQPRVAIAVGLACTILAVQAGMLFRLATAPQAEGAQALWGGPGAAVLDVGATEAAVPVDRSPIVVPDPSVARDDLPTVYLDECHASQTETRVRRCVYGASVPATTVVLIGDSHAAQWLPALQAIAERRADWKVITYTKSSCPYLDIEVADDGKPYRSCVTWNQGVRAAVAEDRPDLIVTSSFNYSAYRDGRVLTGPDNESALVESMRRTWLDLAPVAPVVVLRDTPAPRIDIADCVSGNRERLTKCAVSRDEALAGIGPLQVKATRGAEGVHLVDLTDAICPADRCAAVIGSVLVYRDTNHLTATYARTLAGRLEQRLPLLER
ncbi:acyltransferase family protein [Micromonospora andamanensis]|uniref:acyltransferase family protein n=1 Tax=Micromonospora andamanensis TaxID=1287068 RepID=UPI001A3D87D2|nr:acyltransferase family protein [Micromonospora andamanensis]GIJ40812.1 acyltransferase [Micromonospora andamanensis]